MALAAAGCAEDRRFATAGATKDTGKLVVPARITPPVTVARIEGAPKSWLLNARVAKALRDRDVPAGTNSRSMASYTLNGRVEKLAPSAAGTAGSAGAVPRLRIAWTLLDAHGKRVGSAVQLATHPVAADVKIDANIDKKPDPVALDRLARMAAERLTPLVPHTAVNRNQTARGQGPIWRRVAGAPVTALGKQDARRDGTSLSARFLKLRHVSTVAAANPEERIAAKRRAKNLTAAPPATSKTAAAKTAIVANDAKPPVIKPAGPAASGTALTRRSVVTERIAFVAAHPSLRRPVTAHLVKARPAATPIATRGPVRHGRAALRKDAAIRPAPGTGKFPAAARPIQIAEAAGGRTDDSARGFWVQIASNPSPKASHAAWTALVAAHGSLLERQPHAVNRADLGRKGVYYRLQLGPYPNIAQAKRICANLRAARVACLLIAARGQVAARTPASRRVVTKPLTPAPRAKAPKAKAAPPKATSTKPTRTNLKRPATRTRTTANPRGRPDTKSANRSPAGKAAAGKASAVSPAAGAKGARPDPKSGAKPSARPAIRSAVRSDRRPGSTTKAKPGLGARTEKPKSRAHKLPFQRSRALPGLPD